MNLEIKGALKEYGRKTEQAVSWLGSKAEEWDVRVIHQIGCLGIGAILLGTHPRETLRLLKSEGVIGVGKFYYRFQRSIYEDCFAPIKH